MPPQVSRRSRGLKKVEHTWIEHVTSPMLRERSTTELEPRGLGILLFDFAILRSLYDFHPLRPPALPSLTARISSKYIVFTFSYIPICFYKPLYPCKFNFLRSIRNPICQNVSCLWTRTSSHPLSSCFTSYQQRIYLINLLLSSIRLNFR